VLSGQEEILDGVSHDQYLSSPRAGLIQLLLKDHGVTTAEPDLNIKD